MSRARFSQRSPKAHNIIELSAIAILLVVVAVFCANISVLLIGASLNERACRDAARAAAQGDSYTTSLKLAQAAVAAHAADGYFVTTPAVETASFIYQDYSGNPPAKGSPFVKVTTANTVRVPAPSLFFNVQTGTGGTMSFKTSYVFPIVKTQLYL